MIVTHSAAPALRTGRISRRIFSAVVGACLVAALSPLAAFAVAPSPHLLARMHADPALAKRVHATMKAAKARGVDAPTRVTAGPLPPRVVSGAAASAGSGVGFATATSPLRVFASSGSDTLKWLVLVVDFPDKPASVQASAFDNLIFGDVTGPSSVRGYYREVSAGTLDIQPVAAALPSAVGWLEMPHPSSYYVSGGSNGMGNYPNNGQGLFEDACAAADAAGVDFSQYDSNSDGYVDGVILIHAGTGAEFTYLSSDIWSHSWWAKDEATYDGVKISEYTTEPEYWEQPGDITTGVFCHELGHNFGLPDLYDTTDKSQGLGDWSLMASGSWNGPNFMGASPARPDAWSLVQLGFATPTEATGAVNAESIGAPTTAAEGTLVRVEKNGATGGKEYFLVENRQRRNTDSYLPGSGLLVYHVDETRMDNDNESRYLVGIEEAHGGVQNLRVKYDQNTNPNGYGDAGDPFPGTSNKRSFSPTSSPNSDYFSGPSGIRIDSISSNATTITARFVPDYTFATTDFDPPVTTSNAVASYQGTATITLTASDGATGSGIASTNWTLDGVAGSGTTVRVPKYGAHELVFWSVDFAGHTESPTTADFYVNDIDAPVVASNVSASYSSAGPIDVTITASDTPAGSGVATLSYQLDAETTVTVPVAEVATLSVTGVGTHTLHYWAEDASGNESVHVTKSIALHNMTLVRLATGNVTIWSGVTFRIAGRIDPLATPGSVTGKKMRLQRWTGSAWVSAGVADAPLASNYTFSFGPKPTSSTTYRVIAVTSTGLLPGNSSSVRASVKAILGTPVAPSYVHRYVTFTVKGSVDPHNIGSVVVRWYRVSSTGARSAYGSPKTVAVSSAGTWSTKKKLPKGRFAVRVTHWDSTHANSSSGYRTIKSK